MSTPAPPVRKSMGWRDWGSGPILVKKASVLCEKLESLMSTVMTRSSYQSRKLSRKGLSLRARNGGSVEKIRITTGTVTTSTQLTMNTQTSAYIILKGGVGNACTLA